MCIARISNNFFPFDSKPKSIVATSSLVVAVVAAVLIGVAYALQWGMPAIGSLTGVGGAATLITLALICCKSSSHAVLRMRSDPPIPSQKFPDAFPLAVVLKQQDQVPYPLILNDLYTLVKNGNYATFKKAAALYNPNEFHSICYCSGSIFLDETDTTTTFDKGKNSRFGQTLFHIVIMLKEGPQKVEFLKTILENVEDHGVQEHKNEIFAELLKVENLQMKKLIFKKLDKHAIQYMMDSAVKDLNFPWVNLFFAMRMQDAEIQQAYSQESLCEKILTSSMDKTTKTKYLSLIAQQNKSTLDKFTLNKYWLIKKNVYIDNCTFLHMAIIAQDLELVKALVSYRSLIEKAATCHQSKLTPLLLAVIEGNLNIVVILLKAKANPNAQLATGSLFSSTRRGAAHVTPLMIAASLGRQDIIDTLMLAGADANTKDGPEDDPKAWTMVEYENEFKNRSSQK